MKKDFLKKNSEIFENIKTLKFWKLWNFENENQKTLKI
jgi:hypothetical protein